DYKAWRLVRRQHEIQDGVGAKPLLAGLYFCQTRMVCCLGYQVAGTDVIGMLFVPMMNHRYCGAVFPQHPNHQEPGPRVDRNTAIRESEVLAHLEAENPGGLSGLARPQGGRAARAQLAPSHVHDSSGVTLGRHFSERSSRIQLDIVRMGAKSQNV